MCMHMFLSCTKVPHLFGPSQVNDGATAIVVGNHIHDPEATPLAYVGGSCSVTGYNGQGEEKFWTVSLGGHVLCRQH